MCVSARYIGRVKIASWNINSVRFRIDIVEQFLRQESPDILCLQETKVVDGDFPEAPFRALGYAAALAKWYNARLLVLHVLGPPEPEPVMAPDGGLLEPRRRASGLCLAQQLASRRALAGRCPQRRE